MCDRFGNLRQRWDFTRIWIHGRGRCRKEPGRGKRPPFRAGGWNLISVVNLFGTWHVLQWSINVLSRGMSDIGSSFLPSTPINGSVTDLIGFTRDGKTDREEQDEDREGVEVESKASQGGNPAVNEGSGIVMSRVVAHNASERRFHHNPFVRGPL